MSLRKILSRILIVFSLFYITGCATVPHQQTARIFLEDLCQENNVLWQVDSVSQVVTLMSGRRKAKALVGSDVVIMEGERIQLSHPLQREKSMIIVPPDFKFKIIDPLLAGAVTPPPAFQKEPYKVIVDAGHGGKDPGTIGRTGTQEKKVVLDISHRLRRRLEEKGINVKMTRSEDTFVSLEERTEITSRSQADLFVSIHANSSPSKSAQGVEVYAFRDMVSEDKIEAQRKKNHRIFFDNLSMKKDDPQLEEIVSDMLYRYKKIESLRAASSIAREMSREVKARNRGVKRSGFFVLRNTLIPAILVEVGFLSHAREEKLLKTHAYRQEIADSLAACILNYAHR